MRKCTTSEADPSGSTVLRAQAVTLRTGGEDSMQYIMAFLGALADTLTWG